MNEPRLIYSCWVNDGGKRRKYNEWSGTSDMSKPTPANQAQGSLFHEVDTATLYAYDETTTSWYKQIELGGAG